MKPDEIEKILEAESGEGLGKIYDAVATSYDKVAMSAVIQALAIRQMQKLGKVATRLTKVGIAVGIVGAVLALIQVVLAVIHK